MKTLKTLVNRIHPLVIILAMVLLQIVRYVAVVL